MQKYLPLTRSRQVKVCATRTHVDNHAATPSSIGRRCSVEPAGETRRTVETKRARFFYGPLKHPDHRELQQTFPLQRSFHSQYTPDSRY